MTVFVSASASPACLLRRPNYCCGHGLSCSQVLSMCFSSDGWALAVGHEGALTVWSTEDGTRLVCTTSDSRREDGGSSKSGAVDTSGDCVPVANGGNTSHHTSRYSGGGEIPPSETSGRDDDAGRAAGGAASGTLDLIAGGARALTWESEGYRLISVGGAVSGTAGSGSGAEAQGIVAFDFLRRARSNLSSALLSLQVQCGYSRVASRVRLIVSACRYSAIWGPGISLCDTYPRAKLSHALYVLQVRHYHCIFLLLRCLSRHGGFILSCLSNSLEHHQFVSLLSFFFSDFFFRRDRTVSLWWTLSPGVPKCSCGEFFR